MKTKHKFLTFLFLVPVFTVNAQQWDGVTNSTGEIYRTGTVSLRTLPTSANYPYNTITNSQIQLGSSLGSQYIGQNLTLTKSSIYLGTSVPAPYSSTTIGHGSFNFNFYSPSYSSNFIYANGDLTTNANFTLGTTSVPKILTVNGKIGIGLENPSSKLQIQSEGDYTFIEGQSTSSKMHGLQIWGTDQTMLMGVDTYNRVAYIQSTDLWTAPSTLSLNARGGSVTIGTINNQGYKLAVNGGIICEEVKVITDVPASDYVFEPTYDLKSLKEVETFVKENKHLPEVPSATEFKENGYKVGEMDDLLLRKVEELTLYIIAQQKQIEALQLQINKQ